MAARGRIFNLHVGWEFHSYPSGWVRTVHYHIVYVLHEKYLIILMPNGANRQIFREFKSIAIETQNSVILMKKLVSLTISWKLSHFSSNWRNFLMLSGWHWLLASIFSLGKKLMPKINATRWANFPSFWRIFSQKRCFYFIVVKLLRYFDEIFVHVMEFDLLMPYLNAIWWQTCYCNFFIKYTIR